MSQPNSLHNLCERSLRALDEDSFPQLRDDLRTAIDQEQNAASKHPFNLKIAFGGTEEATVYFSIEEGDLPDEWVTSEGAQVFYQGVDITALFEGEEIDERIYAQSDDVNRQIEDRRVESAYEYHHPYDE